MVRDKANLSRSQNFAKLIGTLSYIPVNIEIEFQIHIIPFGRVTALNINCIIIIIKIPGCIYSFD